MTYNYKTLQSRISGQKIQEATIKITRMFFEITEKRSFGHVGRLCVKQ